jgi:hypothetical protein
VPRGQLGLDIYHRSAMVEDWDDIARELLDIVESSLSESWDPQGWAAGRWDGHRV